jgi:hypothetical protein
MALIKEKLDLKFNKNIWFLPHKNTPICVASQTADSQGANKTITWQASTKHQKQTQCQAIHFR